VNFVTLLSYAVSRSCVLSAVSYEYVIMMMMMMMIMMILLISSV